jgi:uncharacterized membrane protein
MFKFNEKQKDKVSDFFFDTGKYILTATVIVELYQILKGSDGNVVLLGTIAALASLFIGIIIIGGNNNINIKKKRGNK